MVEERLDHCRRRRHDVSAELGALVDVDRIADAVKNAPDLGMGKSLRQALLLRWPNLFLNSPQPLPSVGFP